MGNPKLRLSEMIPNTWFPKLNSSGIPKSSPKPHKSTTNNHPTPSPKPPLSSIRTTRGYPSPEFQGELPLHPDPISPQRKSYYFTRELLSNSKPGSFDFPEQFINPPLISPRRRRRRIKSSTIKHSPVSSPPSETFTKIVSLSSSALKTGDYVSSLSSVDLRPIRTERKKIGGAQEAIDEPFKQKRSSPNCRARRANGSFSVNVVKEDSNSMASSVSGTRSVRRSPTGSPRFRIRAHSPRIATRVQGRGSLSNSVSKKGVSSKSLAVVKSSSDPQRDFRESMVEMIVENNITTPKDLEELLACYISLNSDQYHDVIIEVFAQIWFDLNNLLKEVKK